MASYLLRVRTTERTEELLRLDIEASTLESLSSGQFGLLTAEVRNTF